MSKNPATATNGTLKNEHGLHGWCNDPLAALGGQIHEAPLPSCQRMLEICEFLASFEASCVEPIFFVQLKWVVLPELAGHAGLRAALLAVSRRMIGNSRRSDRGNHVCESR